MRFGCAHNAPIFFFLTFWFQRKRYEALLCVAILKHLLLSVVKLEVENDMEAEFLRTSNGGSSLRSGMGK
jgi:hypothetical protein